MWAYLINIRTYRSLFLIFREPWSLTLSFMTVRNRTFTIFCLKTPSYWYLVNQLIDRRALYQGNCAAWQSHYIHSFSYTPQLPMQMQCVCQSLISFCDYGCYETNKAFLTGGATFLTTTMHISYCFYNKGLDNQIIM